MGRRSNQFFMYDSDDPIDRWLKTLNLKALKRAAIMRGISFRAIAELDVNGLQSWLYDNYNIPIRPKLLEEYDKWRDKALLDEGYIEEPIHVDLKLGFYKIDEDGNEVRERRDINLMGVHKSREEMASFVPRKGSKKTLAYQLVAQGLPTKEIIDKVLEEFPDVSVGSIKVWCSQARKINKIKKEVGF